MTKIISKGAQGDFRTCNSSVDLIESRVVFYKSNLMNRCTTFLFSILIAILSLSCSPREIGNYRKSLDNTAIETLNAKEESRVSFEDQTNEMVGRAERLIEKNEREGAVLDQRWYTLKRLGNIKM